MPATTVTTTMTTMLVARSSEPRPPRPLEPLDAVFDGRRVVVGSGVAQIFVRESSSMAVTDVAVEDELPAAVGRVSGPLVVDIARLAALALDAGSALSSFRGDVRGRVSGMVRSASTHRLWSTGPTVTNAPNIVALRASQKCLWYRASRWARGARQSLYGQRQETPGSSEVWSNHRCDRQ
jgi:hypothetical protein